jgi:hypothetical protein
MGSDRPVTLNGVRFEPGRMTFAGGAQSLGYLCSAKEDEGYMSTTRQSSEEMLQALRSQVNAEPHKTGQARAPWTIEDSEELYRIHGWGDPYFSINAAGT